jgi:hypothetical protein
LPALADAVRRGAVITLRHGSVVAQVKHEHEFTSNVRQELLSPAFAEVCESVLNGNNAGVLFLGLLDLQSQTRLRALLSAGAAGEDGKIIEMPGFDDASGVLAAKATERALRSLGGDRWALKSLFLSPALPYYSECVTNADVRALHERLLLKLGFAKKCNVPLVECNQRNRITDLYRSQLPPSTVTEFSIGRPVLLLIAQAPVLKEIESLLREMATRLPTDELLPIDELQHVLSRQTEGVKVETASRWRCVNLRASLLPGKTIDAVLAALGSVSGELQCLNLSFLSSAKLEDVQRVLRNPKVGCVVFFVNNHHLVLAELSSICRRDRIDVL